MGISQSGFGTQRDLLETSLSIILMIPVIQSQKQSMLYTVMTSFYTQLLGATGAMQTRDLL